MESQKELDELGLEETPKETPTPTPTPKEEDGNDFVPKGPGKNGAGYGLATQLHLCTWCGGHRVQVQKKTKEELDIQVVRTLEIMVIPQNEHSLSKPNMVVCAKCYHKVFNNALGQARFYGIELAALNPPKPQPSLESARLDASIYG